MRTLINFFVRVLEYMLLRFHVSLRRRSAPSLVGFYSPARAFASANRLGELLLSFARLALANFYVILVFQRFSAALIFCWRTATRSVSSSAFLLRSSSGGLLLRDPCAPALF